MANKENIAVGAVNQEEEELLRSKTSEKVQVAAKEEEVKKENKVTATTTTAEATETGWPEIDWSILRTLQELILKLPEFDLTEGVRTVSVEAFKAGAHSIFRCHRCKDLGRGCNLVRCELGHLLCHDCLSSLSSKTEGSCLYFTCPCSKVLKDAFGDNNEMIKSVWGHGVRRRMGR